MVRGDRNVNEIKVVNKLGIAEHEMVLATTQDIESLGSVEGFVSPVGIKDVTVLVDEEVSLMKNIVVGANKKDYHLKNVNFRRDFNGEVGQFRNTEKGDKCPICGAPLGNERGIEVGQIFKLGTKYSEPMGCTYQDDDGKVKPMVMGCYGIGVTRTMSSIIEQNHDEFGIKWPLNVAPYHVVIIPVKYADESQKALADKIYAELKKARVEVVLDDRNAGFGFKAKDWELIGIPYQIVVGREAANDVVEFKVRETNVKTPTSSLDAINQVIYAVNSL
jgi:prolyl-tRNA synthetase